MAGVFEAAAEKNLGQGLWLEGLDFVPFMAGKADFRIMHSLENRERKKGTGKGLEGIKR